MNLLQFLKETPNWREVLAGDPYNVKIKDDGKLTLLKYSIESKWNEITKQCRGCIIDTETMEYVARPFDKFFNSSETYADQIDWNTAVVEEKLDGSIVKLFWNPYTEEWQWATNGNIDAKNAPVTPSLLHPDVKTFQDLIDLALMDWTTQTFHGHSDKNATHMFELCTPINKVVVPHKSYTLYYLRSRNNLMGWEYKDEWIAMCFKTPKIYEFGSIEECLNTAKELPYDQEGYVVRDASYHRNKVKSIRYLAVHRMKGEGVLSINRAMDILRLNEKDEFLAYFPEYTEIFTKLQEQYDNLVTEIKRDWEDCQKRAFASRKELATWNFDHYMLPWLIFTMYDDKLDSIDEAIKQVKNEVFIKLMEKENV